MELTVYQVIYLPFPDSDSLSAAYWTGKDEDDCRKSWERAHPSWPVKSVEEKETP